MGVILIVMVFFILFKDHKIASGVSKFGSLTLGETMIYGEGDWTFAPYKEIPRSKFYVNIAQSNFWCINDECGLEGAMIEKMGGWLQMDDAQHRGWIDEERYGFDLKENKNIKSIVLIGNQNSKIVGIYPDKSLTDIISILKLHPDLANFDLLKR